MFLLFPQARWSDDTSLHLAVSKFRAYTKVFAFRVEIGGFQALTGCSTSYSLLFLTVYKAIGRGYRSSQHFPSDIFYLFKLSRFSTHATMISAALMLSSLFLSASATPRSESISLVCWSVPSTYSSLRLFGTSESPTPAERCSSWAKPGYRRRE